MKPQPTQGAVAPRPGTAAPAIAEEKEAQLPQLASNYGFSDEEVQGGMDIGSEGYVSQYNYMVVIDGAEFKVVETSTRNEIKTARELNAVLFYGHPVYRLHKGTVRGIGGEMKDWQDEDKELAAQSYGTPFGNLQHSRGNFDAAGHAEYLDNKDLRKLVKKRLYLVMSLPGVLPKGELAIGTFGGSALKPFQDYAAYVKSLPAPLPFIGTTIYLKQDKNEEGQTYQKLQFKPMLSKDGKVAQAMPDKAAYDAHIKPILATVIETHQHAMKRQEQSTGVAEAAPAQRAMASSKPVSSNVAVYEPAPGEQDSVPDGAFSDEFGF